MLDVALPRAKRVQGPLQRAHGSEWEIFRSTLLGGDPGALPAEKRRADIVHRETDTGLDRFGCQHASTKSFSEAKTAVGSAKASKKPNSDRS